MGKSPRASQGRSIARRMESSGGRRKQKGDGLVPGSKHAGLFSDDAIASFDELLNSDDVGFRTAPGPPVRRAPPPEPDPAAAAAGTPSWIPSALRTASSGRWLSWINVAMLLVLLLGASLAYVYVGGSEWTEPAEADMRLADTSGMVESSPAASEPPSAKDIIEEYRRKRLAKEAAEAKEREARLAARMAEVANEATTSPAPEPAPPAPSLEPEAAPPPPRRAMKPKATADERGAKPKSKSTDSSRPKSTSTDSSQPKSTSAGSETDEERAARYAREDAAREARIRREDEERAARIEEEEKAARARVEELAGREAAGGAPAGGEAKPAAVVDAVDYEEEEDRPAPVQQRKKEREKEREEAPAVAGNLGVDYE